MVWKFSGKQDIYLEIAEKYEEYILKGILKKGDKLPSVRIAAQEMGVNPNTVARAYSLLEDRGFICSLPKKGVFVKLESSDEKEKILSDCKGNLIHFKNQGVDYDDFISILKEVFKKND